MRIVVTGGCGFMGSAYVRHLLARQEDLEVVVLDKLTYAANPTHLEIFRRDPRVCFIHGDVTDRVAALSAVRGADVVVHFAAESHNDRGFVDPALFVSTNVGGTQVLLDACRASGARRFHQISTCEVFGDLPLGGGRPFDEDAPYRPTTPYAASKAAADHLVLAYGMSFGLHVTVSRSCNNYGPWQFPEKVIPRFITAALADRPLPVFRSSQNRREWIHVTDHSAAVDMIVRRGTAGRTYNIGSGVERSIDELADAVLSALGKPPSLKVIVPDRPRHDRRYLLDSRRIRAELNFRPRVGFEAGLSRTIDWYAAEQGKAVDAFTPAAAEAA